MRPLFICCLFLAGCGLAELESSSAPPGGADQSQGLKQPGGRLIPPPACQKYPLAFTADPTTEQRVRDAAAKHWPGASLQFSAARGAPSFITGFQASLRSCAKGELADAPLRDFLKSYADVFQLEASEWVWENAASCEAVSSWPTPEYVTLKRAHAAGQSTASQTLVLRVTASKSFAQAPEFATVDVFVGHYVQPSAALAHEMSGCASLPDDDLQKIVATEKYPFSTFQYCVPTGSGVYEPKANDVAAFASKDGWHHEELNGAVTFSLRRDATLTVDAANWTPELYASDAACGNPVVIGFSTRLDSVKGGLVDKRPGIGCVVCLK